MDKEPRQASVPEPVQVKSRPVLLTVLCLFSFVYFALLSFLFFIFVFYSGRIAVVRNLYIPEDKFTGSQLLFILVAGFLMHLAAFAGTFLIWFLRRAGFWLLALSCLVMALYQILQPHISLGTTGVYIILIPFFGLFFRRLH